MDHVCLLLCIFGMLAMCCLTGWHTYACQLYKMLCGSYVLLVVVTVIGVSFILKTDLLVCLLERKAKFLVQLMTVTQLQQSIISFFFCKCCSLHRNFVGSTLYLSHITNSGTHVCESSLSSITDKPLSMRILFIMLAISC